MDLPFTLHNQDSFPAELDRISNSMLNIYPEQPVENELVINHTSNDLQTTNH